MTIQNASSILSEAYRLARYNEVTSDWDHSETESLYESVLEMRADNQVEFLGLIAVRDALINAAQSDGDGLLIGMSEGLGIEPEEFPTYILKQEPEFYSVLQAKEAVSLLAKASNPLGDSDRAISCRGIADTLQSLDFLGDETVEEIFSSMLGEGCSQSDSVTEQCSDDQLSAMYIQRGGCTCLICKDESIEGGSIQTDSGIAWQKVWCNSCGSEWTDNYKLVSTSDLSTNVPFRLGQEVQWTDPDADISSGVYTVKSIEAEDVVIIVNESGSKSEVPVSELKAVKAVVQTQVKNKPQEKKYSPAIVEDVMQDLTEAGTVFSGETKPVDINLAALIRLNYMETVLVPVEFGDQQLEELVNRTYDVVDGGDYCNDHDYWERGTCNHIISDSRTVA